MQPVYLAKQANRSILRAIVRYGIVNFAFIVLETCNPSETLTREQYWLDLLNPDYNLCRKAGSTLGVPLSVEAKAKLSTAHLGKTHTLETRLLMSKTRKGTNAYWYGKNHSEETKAKISAALKGPLSPCFGVPRPAETLDLMRKNHPHTKAVFQYASDQITFIAKFDSVRQAAESVGISRGYLSR